MREANCTQDCWYRKLWDTWSGLIIKQSKCLSTSVFCSITEEKTDAGKTKGNIQGAQRRWNPQRHPPPRSKEHAICIPFPPTAIWELPGASLSNSDRCSKPRESPCAPALGWSGIASVKGKGAGREQFLLQWSGVTCSKKAALLSCPSVKFQKCLGYP